MKNIFFTITFILCFAATGNAQSKQDIKTIAFMNAFTRHVTQHDENHTQCIHTVDVAQEHLAIWQQWNKTRRWPEIIRADREYKNVQRPKADATSIVRVSLYREYHDVAEHIEADNSGRVGRSNTRYDMGPYETNAFYLKPKQMSALQKTLRELPPSRKVLDWADVLMISGRQDGRWFVRMYSRKSHPQAVGQLFYLLSHNPKSGR